MDGLTYTLNGCWENDDMDEKEWMGCKTVINQGVVNGQRDEERERKMYQHSCRLSHYVHSNSVIVFSIYFFYCLYMYYSDSIC